MNTLVSRALQWGCKFGVTTSYNNYNYNARRSSQCASTRHLSSASVASHTLALAAASTPRQAPGRHGTLPSIRWPIAPFAASSVPGANTSPSPRLSQTAAGLNAAVRASCVPTLKVGIASEPCACAGIATRPHPLPLPSTGAPCALSGLHVHWSQ